MVAGAFLAGGCGGGSAETIALRTQPPPDVPRAGAGKVLTGLVEAASAGDEARMWSLLARETRALFGPTLADFRRIGAVQLEDDLDAFARGGFGLVLDEKVEAGWAVAAIAGERVMEGLREYDAYGAALRRERGDWKLHIGSNVEVTLLLPDATKTGDEPQIAVEIAAGAPILHARLWLDGRRFPAETHNPDPSTLTIFTQARELAPGPHTIVVFARTIDNASASAWSFVVED